MYKKKNNKILKCTYPDTIILTKTLGLEGSNWGEEEKEERYTFKSPTLLCASFGKTNAGFSPRGLLDPTS